MKPASEKLEEMIRKYEDNPQVILSDKVPSINDLKMLKKQIVKLENERNQVVAQVGAYRALENGNKEAMAEVAHIALVNIEEITKPK